MTFRKVNLLPEFQQLERSLEQLLPKSSQIINLLRLAILDKFPNQSSNDFYIFCDPDEDVDSQNQRSPITKIDPASLFLVCIQIPNIFSPYCIITWSPDLIKPSMISAFDSLIDWGRAHLFSQTSKSFAPKLEELCASRGWDPNGAVGVTKSRYDGQLFTLDPKTALTFEPHPHTIGNLRITDIPVNHAPKIISNWKLAQPHSLPTMEDAIALFPSVGIYSDGDELISSAITSTKGLINVVYTEEGWRRRGLGGLTVSSLGKKIAEFGLIPCAEIERGNSSSEAMLVKAGFVEVLDTVWIYFDKARDDKE